MREKDQHVDVLVQDFQETQLRENGKYACRGEVQHLRRKLRVFTIDELKLLIEQVLQQQIAA